MNLGSHIKLFSDLIQDILSRKVKSFDRTLQELKNKMPKKICFGVAELNQG